MIKYYLGVCLLLTVSFSAVTSANDLMIAYLNQDSEKVIEILESSLPPGDDGVEERSNALLTSVEQGNLKVSSYLINKGVNIDVKNDGGNTPLLIASAEKYADIAEMLIDSGASIEVTNNLYEQTPLLLASKFGAIDIVRLLIEKGADISATDYLGKTALHWAAIPYSYNAVGGDELLVYLMEQGLDINKRDAAGNTVLGDPVIQNESGEQFDKIRETLVRLGGEI